MGEPLSEDDLNLVVEFEEEQFRLGNFEKIYPCINNVGYYSQFFEVQRGANILLQKYLQTIAPKHNQHHICAESKSPLMLSDTKRTRRKLKATKVIDNDSSDNDDF